MFSFFLSVFSWRDRKVEGWKTSLFGWEKKKWEDEKYSLYKYTLMPLLDKNKIKVTN